MNADDLALLRDLATRTQHAAQLLQALLEWQGEVDVTADVAALAEVEEAIGGIATRIQQREVMSWGRTDRKARHPEPRRYLATGLPLSTAVDHGLKVRRYGVSGQPVSEKPATPPISGRWHETEDP